MPWISILPSLTVAAHGGLPFGDVGRMLGEADGQPWLHRNYRAHSAAKNIHE